MPQQARDFGDDTDLDLVAYMAMRDEDRAGAVAAFGELFRRHRRLLLAVCRRRWAAVSWAHGPEDLVGEAFRRAWDLVADFEHPPEKLPPDRATKHVQRWLIFQAWAVVKSIRRATVPVGLLGDDDPADSQASAGPLSPERRAAVRALEELPERTRIVVIEYLQHFRLDGKNQRMPNDVSKDLAQRLKTTPANVRQIWSRAKKSLRARIDELLSEERAASGR